MSMMMVGQQLLLYDHNSVIVAYSWEISSLARLVVFLFVAVRG